MPELFGRSIEVPELFKRIGRFEQVAGVRLVTFGDGAERGVRVLEFHTGTGFRFEVIVDRAMDIGRCELGGVPLAWQSPTGIVGPWFYEPDSLGWLRGFFGGMLTTCGAEHALFMATDTAEQYHYPAKETETYGLHGRISYQPARLTGYGERWDGDTCTLWAEGEVRQAAVFGEQMLVHRHIEARVGESRLKIHDSVWNTGWNPQPHMFLYHVNIGFPIVDDGSEILVPASAVTPRGDYSADGYRTLEAPKPAYVERVFEHELVNESNGDVPVAIVNRDLGVGAYEVFNRIQMPRHVVWRMLGEGHYVVGIEPSTNRPAGRLAARERGELIILQPGERREYDLELGALNGNEAIDAFAARVLSIAGASAS
jgi:Domain of unknown function (DUF4432)